MREEEGERKKVERECEEGGERKKVERECEEGGERKKVERECEEGERLWEGRLWGRSNLEW